MFVGVKGYANCDNLVRNLALCVGSVTSILSTEIASQGVTHAKYAMSIRMLIL
jgi:hypothetical protein